MQKYVVTIVENFKPALAVLFVAVIGIQSLIAGSFAMTQTQGPSARKAELETSTEAKRALTGIGSQDFKRIKDAKLRDASVRALAALKAIAKNTSKDREAELADNFEHAINTLKALRPASHSTAMSLHQCDASYDRCIELCKRGAGDCKLCGIAQNGCYLAKLAIDFAQEEDPSKH